MEWFKRLASGCFALALFGSCFFCFFLAAYSWLTADDDKEAAIAAIESGEYASAYGRLSGYLLLNYKDAEGYYLRALASLVTRPSDRASWDHSRLNLVDYDDTDKGMSDLAKAIELDSEYVDAICLLAAVHRVKGIEKNIKYRDHLNDRFVIKDTFHHLKAIELCTRAIQHDHQSKEAYFIRAQCYANLGEFEKCEADSVTLREFGLTGAQRKTLDRVSVHGFLRN